MNEAETINGISRTRKHDDRATTDDVKALKRKDLLNYFKKLEKAFQREISSQDEEDYKSSSTDLGGFVDANKHVRRGSPIFIASSSSSCISNRKRSGKAKTSKKFHKNIEFSRNSVRVRDPSCYKNPLNRHYDKSKLKLIDRAIVPTRICNSKCTENGNCLKIQKATSFQVNESWSEGKIEKLRSPAKSRELSRKGSSAPLFTAQREDSACTFTYSKHQCNSKDIFRPRVLKSKHAFRRKWSDRIDENLTILSAESSRYLLPIKDDLNSLEILRCEELLNREKEKAHRRRLKFNSHTEGTSKENSRFNATPSILTKSKSRYSKCKEIDRRASVFERDRRRSKDKNRRSYPRNNERTNTSAREETVTCKNNASACYEQRKEEVEEKLCKLINTRQSGKWFGSLDETETQTTKETALKRRSEYCLCPESVDTRGCLEHLPQHCQRSSEAIKNDDFVRNGRIVDYVCRPLLQTLTLERNRKEDEKIHGFPDDWNQRFFRKNPSTKNEKGSINIETDKRRFGRARYSNKQTVRKFDDDDQRSIFNEEANIYRKEGIQIKKTAPLKVTRRKDGRSPSKTRSVLIEGKIRSAYPFKEEASFETNVSVKRLQPSSDIAEVRGIVTSNLARDDPRQVSLRSVSPTLRQTHNSYSRVDTLREIAPGDLVAGKESNATFLFTDCKVGKDPVRKYDGVLNGNGESVLVDFAKSRLPEFSRRVGRKAHQSRPRSHYYSYKDRLQDEVELEKLWVQNESTASRRGPNNSANVRVVKPKDAYGKTNLKKILVYPPRGKGGPPLTLYKNTSNIDCAVKGNTRVGFQYTVTYIQKFASPVLCPEEDELSSFSNAEPMDGTTIPTMGELYNCSGDFTKDTI